MKLTLLATVAIGFALTVSAGPIGYSVSSNGNDHLYRIDLATGVATDLGLVNFDDAEGLEWANGVLYGIGGTSNQLWNLTSPPGSLIGATGTRNGIDAGLGFNPATGIMYNMGGNSGASSLYTVDLGTGATTLVGSGTVFADNLAINASGNAYALDGIFDDSLYSVNLSTGAFALVGGLGLGDISSQFGSDFDPTGILWALSDAGEIYTINAGTGAAAFVAQVRLGSLTGTTLSGFEGLAIDTGAGGPEVPEPATYFSVVSGLAIVAALRRRQRA